MTGIGFLGGGAILRSGTSVHGMTTAATIWVNAAVGMAAGAGLYAIAIAALTYFSCFRVLVVACFRELCDL